MYSPRVLAKNGLNSVTSKLANTTLSSSSSSSALLSSRPSIAVAALRPSANHHHHQQQQQVRTMGYKVRVIMLEDDWTAKKGDVVRVKIGYARHRLIPSEMAVYATPKNFKKLGMLDPKLESRYDKVRRLAKEQDGEIYTKHAQQMKHYYILKQYLYDKVLTIYRQCDPITGLSSPGHLDHDNIREKLSKHLKVDLEEYEKIHLTPLPVPWIFEKEENEEMKKNVQYTINNHTTDDETTTTTTVKKDTSKNTSQKQMDMYMKEQLDVISVFDDCEVKIRQPGTYIARITIAGGHEVPLKVRLEARDFTPKDPTKTRWIRKVRLPDDAQVDAAAGSSSSTESTNKVE